MGLTSSCLYVPSYLGVAHLSICIGGVSLEMLNIKLMLTSVKTTLLLVTIPTLVNS